MWSPTRSLRGRIASSISVFGVLVAVTVVGVVGFASWQRVRSEAPNRAENLTFDVAELDESILDEIEAFDVPDGQLALVLNPDGIALIADVDVSNRVVTRALRSAALDAARGEFVSLSSEEIDGVQWEFASLLCADEAVCDVILTGASTPSMRTYLLTKWPVGLFAALLGGVASFAAAYWLVGRSLRPIELMRQELASITASNLGRRVTLTASGDEVERVGVTLNRTLDQLDEAVQANERFVADAAHELRSPLTGIRLALEIESTNKPVSLLNDALEEVDRATHLVDDLLLLANRSSKKHQVDLNARDLIAQEVVRFRARHPLVSLTENLQLVRIRADQESLCRLITNLLDNAAFYGSGQVGIALTAATGMMVVHVDDNGTGIADADRTRIFDRFTRLDSSRARTTGGTGLGLAIARQIAEDHNGSVSVADSPLGGARFTVQLPVVMT
jgi:signal transduction histidine kinase